MILQRTKVIDSPKDLEVEVEGLVISVTESMTVVVSMFSIWSEDRAMANIVWDAPQLGSE